MIPQVQSRVGKRGRCFNACLASILELPEASVPDFDEDDYWQSVDDWLSKFGLYYRQVPLDIAPVGWHTVEGTSPRGGQHAVVGYNGEMVWDPHPEDGTGKWVKPRIYGVLISRGQGTISDQALALDIHELSFLPDVGELIKLPNGKVTRVVKVERSKDLYDEPEYHISTSTGEVLTHPIKEK